MLKSEMQHQFWVTKKAVQRKLGTKEDECIVASDAELDAKIELFRSISESCGQLYRIIDHYQERLCILAQEENSLGKFLKEMGKSSNTTGKVMLTAGKSISYCGQQRMMMRPPLLRLFHEVEVFRGRAIADTQATIIAMEKERTEYRGALSWMKSASNQLDPDTGKGLEKFRKSQTHVRLSKVKFDRLSLDCLQKIDLLAAARCNMFSHALVAYMSALLQFATKSSETFKATAQALSANPQYNFCILKDLSECKSSEAYEKEKDLDGVKPIDSDQMLFFLDEYSDDQKGDKKVPQSAETTDGAVIEKKETPDLVELSNSNKEKDNQDESTNDILEKLIDIDVNQTHSSISNGRNPTKSDFSNVFDDFVTGGLETPPHFMPSQLLLDDSSSAQIFSNNEASNGDNAIADINDAKEEASKSKNSILDFLNLTQISKTSERNQDRASSTVPPKLREKTPRKDMSAWFHLFSELDPLANPDTMASKIEGGKGNSQAA